MRRIKSYIAVIAALGPVVYCGGFLYHFIDVGGSIHGATEIGLGPTLLGLAIVGGLFCIPLVFRIMRIFREPRSPGSDGGPDAPPRGGEGGFDADAVVARYVASRSSGVGATSPSAPPNSGPAKSRGFGRRVT